MKAASDFLLGNSGNRHALSLMALVFLVGCQSAPVRDPEFAAVRPPLHSHKNMFSGSIYQAGYDVRLFEDIKARRVGDILTVQLVESTDASKSAATKATKDSTTTVTNPTILGTSPQFGLPGFVPLQNTDNLSLQTNLSAEREFDGSGESSQKNALSGNITVTVVEVLPNGNLIVRGEKRVTLNNGNEYIRLSGIVRPVDIGQNNSVASTKIADATIVYTGDGGPVSGANIAGFLAKFFISALFPF